MFRLAATVMRNPTVPSLTQQPALSALAKFGFDHSGHCSGVVCVVDVLNRAIDSDDPILRVDRVGCGRTNIILGVNTAVLVKEYGHGEPELLSKSDKFCVVILSTDSPDLNPLFLIRFPNSVVDVRDLGRTNRSPGREINKDHRLADMVGQCVKIAVQVGQDEVWGGLPDEDTGAF